MSLLTLQINPKFKKMGEREAIFRVLTVHSQMRVKNMGQRCNYHLSCNYVIRIKSTKVLYVTLVQLTFAHWS